MECYYFIDPGVILHFKRFLQPAASLIKHTQAGEVVLSSLGSVSLLTIGKLPLTLIAFFKGMLTTVSPVSLLKMLVVLQGKSSYTVLTC